MKTETTQSPRQKLFKEMVFGTLVYVVVLGFFEEYTEILDTWSYSTTFLVAIVMQILTYITFWLKSLVIKRFKGKQDKKFKAYAVLGVWLIMFFSKFIFLALISFIFGSNVELRGFIGLVAIILSTSLVKKFIDIIYIRLE